MQDIQVVAQLREAGVPLDDILSSKIRGRNGLIRKIEGMQKKADKEQKKADKKEKKNRKKSSPEPAAPLPPHLAGTSDASTFKTFAVA